MFCEQVESLYPRPGWVELDPEVLWSQFVGVIKEAVQGNGLMNSLSKFDWEKYNLIIEVLKNYY